MRRVLRKLGCDRGIADLRFRSTQGHTFDYWLFRTIPQTRRIESFARFSVWIRTITLISIQHYGSAWFSSLEFPVRLNTVKRSGMELLYGFALSPGRHPILGATLKRFCVFARSQFFSVLCQFHHLNLNCGPACQDSPMIQCCAAQAREIARWTAPVLGAPWKKTPNPARGSFRLREKNMTGWLSSQAWSVLQRGAQPVRLH